MPQLPPHEILQQVTAGFYLSRCLQVVADLGVADHLGDEPATACSLAQATGSNAVALERALDLLCAHGIFERRDGGIAHTPTSRLLRTRDPHSMRSFVRMFGLPVVWTYAMNLDRVVRTGEPLGDDVIPGGFWGHLAGNPGGSRLFDEAMTGKARAQMSGAVSAYDFSKFPLIADIGGGRGHLLQAILAACPGSKGVLFDQSHVIQQSSGMASDRLSLRAGDFFKDDLPVCDAYILMEVIHDWPDEESKLILKAVRRAAPKHAKVLLIEAPIPNDSGPSWPKTLDIVMLTLGGSQRTTDQYRSLFAAGGFHLDRVVDIGPPYSIFEASVV
jgi:O-methyltransferase domain